MRLVVEPWVRKFSEWLFKNRKRARELFEDGYDPAVWGYSQEVNYLQDKPVGL